MAKDFVLEIGVEELPARFLEPALTQLQKLTEQSLQEHRLAYEEIITCGTPRRITVFVRKVAETQQSLLQEVKGPAVKVAFNADGEPTRAALGFAKSNGVKVEDLVRRSVGPVDYVFAVKQEAGRPAAAVLKELAPELITGLHFPKPMRWGDLDMRFARPIRWLLCLLGGDVLPFTMAGLQADRYTYGHRFLSSGKLVVDEAGAYFDVMRKANVIVDLAERREIIRRQVTEAAAREGGQAEIDPDLLDEVTNIVEYPTALCGSFDKEYLQMPGEVLITPMREHQRYFPVRDEGGNLLPRFIAVGNGGTDQESINIIRAGNEKVLRARLSDAAFFWQEDLKTNLADRVEGLQKVVFQESLGTVYEKVQRITALADLLAARLGASLEEQGDTTRAAYLAKADLLTNMVYEFPELQGIMGREYALRQGEPQRVARAIYEHYLPRFAGDELPETLPGRVLSIADKADTIVGCFGVGIMPTGSQDPYALRRQALGICHIILDGGLVLSLREIIARAYSGYTGRVHMKLTLEQVTGELEEFFRQRLRGLFIDRGLPYDTVDAVLAAGIDDLAGTWLRGQALEEFRTDPAFDALLTAFTRAYNLARKAAHDRVDPALFDSAAERELYQAFQSVSATATTRMNDRAYGAALSTIARLQEPVDRFFNDVMVMVDDERIRDNRLALLKKIAAFIGSMADLSKMVTSNK
ncbi:glycine--tRNA ligase subunit beta [Desulfallas thermosapovorans]|uniref:Glycine--tRNA ligase beta subunit n=1 Tax=Desulfallas thermosapovorans DSM 6562 TaxID=1121431 RepID=A0A5S4ZW80_9FIRM|nr:glycine--tRNA ligase subunit beta [Desulfallas thermosapovorans]TYO97275.1 glycyl-tRNA synthetase beta chain [Desulfallas thermosapovorans DSM 6562]